MDAMLGFAAGIMIAASFFSLLEPSLKMAESLKMIPWIVTTIGFISGGLLLFIGDRIFTKIDKKISKNKDENNKTKSLKNVLQYTEDYYRTMQKGEALRLPLKH